MTILSDKELDFVRRRMTGAVEIEPKPQDGRRLENRVAALEGLVEKLSRDQPARITDLQQQVQNNNWLYGLLNGRLDGVEEDQGELAQQVQALREGLDVMTQRYAVSELSTPPQPAAEAKPMFTQPRLGEKHADGSVWDGEHWTQPAADDAEKVTDKEWLRLGWFITKQVRGMSVWETEVPEEIRIAKAITDKAVELGLVPRVNPNDPEQVRVVAEAIDCRGYVSERDLEAGAESILTALASHLGKLNGASDAEAKG